MMARLWLDVEDLFEYARAHPRPSGIQRLAFEIYTELQALPDCGEFVRFVRHDYARNSFRVVAWSEIEALFNGMTNSAPEAIASPDPIMPHGASRRVVRKLVYRLPPSLRIHVIDVLLTQRTAMAAWAKLFDAMMRGVLIRLKAPFRRFVRRREAGAVVPRPVNPTTPPVQACDRFAATSQPGDVILVLGSPWSHPDYAMLIQAHKRRGLKFGLLVYDLIPLRRPEWCERGLVRLFRAWFESVFPLCDVVFAISRATAADVEAYTRERGIRLACPVAPIPIGTSLGARYAQKPQENARALPRAGSYALIVSTVEARKNHILLFRVWRRLLEEMREDDVPTLVFAGRIGWLVDDLFRQIANTSNLDGKLVVIENPTDSELAALYSGCRFTLFPSFFEGWGLPVTESLAFGKPCISSNRTSLPEAGGKLTRRFDPDNLNEAYSLIRATIEDHAGLIRWENQIKREFKPVPWSSTVEAILDGLDIHTRTVISLDQVRQEEIRQADIAELRLESRAG